MSKGGRRNQHGFTLIEVVVGMAVVLILAAVALPQLAGFLDQKKIDETATQLAQVRDALYNPSGSGHFFDHVNSHAGKLSELTIALTATDLDSCQTTFTGGQRGNWAGPYLNYVIDPTAGMATPIGNADNLLTRNPSGGGTGTLRITFTNNVKLADAEALDRRVDGLAGWNTGTVQWTPQLGTDGVVTLHYFVPINSTC